MANAPKKVLAMVKCPGCGKSREASIVIGLLNDSPESRKASTEGVRKYCKPCLNDLRLLEEAECREMGWF